MSVRTFFGASAAALAFAGTANATITTTASTDAVALADALAGEGVNISNATLSGTAVNGAGFFSGGSAAGLGFDQGILLATGDVANAEGPNDSDSLTGPGSSTTLSFDFTTTTGGVFFQYVFGSEEYEEFVGSTYNDTFTLLINGVNVALIPGTSTGVAINNVNQTSNTAYYRSNVAGVFDLQYDGFTTVLTATATGLDTVGVNTALFSITDVDDASYDSGVFIRGGSLSVDPPGEVPAPGALGLLGLGVLGLALRRRKLA
ncbi:choice-of-anchor L family PEP-CTERM protein [Pacificimonas flava]|uniref:Ice-binding protein C-terminal domain-containing protein n=1 Tax=Pacificimonas flava TaxID=1234595 RepID=M2TMN3_9SPHN|nr:choice-of-anchor L domain-containing protein [Pacificimonas flava]EMD82981.1 hypothetical protein C725_1579 [Pacificimonas flava]MBB5280141.1 hypothetical protein [Pacificimonas flava]